MKLDEIIRMAIEAELVPDALWETPELERFAELVAAAEREACAKVCETLWDLRDDERARMHANKCAEAIRARGQKEPT